MTQHLPKDILGLVFWELDKGHDLITFSEISRRCHQIFHQNLEVIRKNDFEDAPKIYTIARKENMVYGLYRWWHQNGQLYQEHNYIHGKCHYNCEWYTDGGLVRHWAS